MLKITRSLYNHNQKESQKLKLIKNRIQWAPLKANTLYSTKLLWCKVDKKWEKQEKIRTVCKISFKILKK